MNQTLIVGIGPEHNPERAATLKAQIEERLGIEVIIIGGATSIAVIETP